MAEEAVTTTGAGVTVTVPFDVGEHVGRICRTRARRHVRANRARRGRGGVAARGGGRPCLAVHEARVGGGDRRGLAVGRRPGARGHRHHRSAHRDGAVLVGEGVVRVGRARAGRRVVARHARRRRRGRTGRQHRGSGLVVHQARVARRDGRHRAAHHHRTAGRGHLDLRRLDRDRAVHVGDRRRTVHRAAARRRVGAGGRRRRRGRGAGRGSRRLELSTRQARVPRRDRGHRVAVGDRRRRGGDQHRAATTSGRCRSLGARGSRQGHERHQGEQ